MATYYGVLAIAFLIMGLYSARNTGITGAWLSDRIVPATRADRALFWFSALATLVCVVLFGVMLWLCLRAAEGR